MISRSKTTHKVVRLASGIIGGALAGAVFSRLWRALTDEAKEVPEATALDHDLRDVLLAAVLQGAVTGLIKAVLSRITEHGYRRFSAEESAEELER
ncbi:MAG: DUF4235 domain-containing protein [Pseudonocardiaceae bacterium]